ncbi:NADH oxidase 3 [Cladorrhinum sp. PSN332]|nr:NADH oxidase 3 [Cladorrhinum sp. PSN332]
MASKQPDSLQIAKPLTLKCGLTLPNRLVKAAMAEWLNDSETKLPSDKLNSLSKHWATGGWGMLITGNVDVDPRHTGSPEDVVVDPSLPVDSILPSFTRWAESFKFSTSFSDDDGNKRPPVLVQINHPGRQSPRGAGSRGFFGKTVAPSAVAINWGPGILAWLLRTAVFGTPRELTIPEVDEVVRNFAHAARVVAEAGFDGVQIHGAHGYLLSQFLSSRTNKRTDKYGGSAEKRARVVVEIIEAVREATREFKGFAVGIKLNSADHQSEREVEDVVKQFKMIAEAGVDFVEVSGGSYENPSMALGLENKSERTKAREAFFLEFASLARRELPGVPLLVTGGFSSRLGMENAVARGDCDLVGLGRPAILNPTLPGNTIFNREVKDEDAKLYRGKNEPSWLIKQLGIRAVGAGADTVSFYH